MFSEAMMADLVAPVVNMLLAAVMAGGLNLDQQQQGKKPAPHSLGLTFRTSPGQFP